MLLLSFIPLNLAAQNCGTQGSLYPIQEQSALEWIKERLLQLEASGEIAKQQALLKRKALERLENPEPILGLIPTNHPRVFEKDITVSFPQDIQGPNQTVIYQAGTRINPLSNPLLHTQKVLIFFDGEDKQQLHWALQQYQQRSGLAKLVLVKGSALKLMRRYEVPFYFDQKGRLTHYFGFKQIPAMVYQAGEKLRVAEIKP